MSRNKPKLTVGMPVYNGEQFIQIAIESILDQTFADFELLISDNASTDRTEAICRDLATRDERIIYSRNDKNLGAAANYNRLVDLASADYFRWSNADDVIAPTLHERCFEVLEANPDAVLSYGKTKIIDGDGVEGEDYDDNLDLQQERPSDRFLRFREVVGLTNAIYGLMRTAALRRSARMGNGSYPAADNHLMAELVLYGKFIEIPERLFYRRMHAATSTANRGQEATEYFWSAGTQGFTLPTWRKVGADLRAIWRAPIGPDEKGRLTLYMLRVMYWRRRKAIPELLGAIGKKSGLISPK